MNVEIRKVANGYLVFPERCDRRGDFHVVRDEDIYVFPSYSALMEGLLSIFEIHFPEKK